MKKFLEFFIKRSLGYMWMEMLCKASFWSLLYFLLIILMVYQSHDPNAVVQKAKTIFQYQQF